MRYTTAVFNPNGKVCNNDNNIPEFANSTHRSKSSAYRLQLFNELIGEGYLLYWAWGPAKNQRAYHMPGRNAEGKKVKMTAEYAYTLYCKGLSIGWVKKEKVQTILSFKGRTFTAIKCE